MVAVIGVRDALAENPAVKKWVRAVMESGQEMSDALGMQVGDVLGCGHYGCVLDLPGPWVLKLTIDPHEAFMWRRIRAAVAEDGVDGAGFTRVRDIYELDPGVRYGGKRRRAYAIVREEAEPMLASAPPVSRGVYPLSQASAEHLRMDLEWSELPHGVPVLSTRGVWYSVGPKTPLTEDFEALLEALYNYRRVADAWSASIAVGAPRYHSTPRLVDRGYYLSALAAAFELPDRPWRIEASLYELYEKSNLMLADVHIGNLGWRVHDDIDGFRPQPRTLVVYDPGHTRLGREERRTPLERLPF